MKAYLPTVAAMLALASGAAAAAQPAAKPMGDMKGMSAPAPATKTGQGVGVVTEIDPKSNTVTIKHEPIKSLGWPAMTMGFHATSPSLLKGLKAGDRVAFSANQGSGLPEVTAIKKR